MNLQYVWEMPAAGRIYDLYEQLGWNSYLQLSEERLAQAMKNSLYSLYVYDDSQLVATGRIVSDGVINAYLCGVGVLESYRQAGIGAEIVRLLTERCEQDGLHMQLFCDDALVSYYEKMDYQVFAVGMRKEL